MINAQQENMAANIIASISRMVVTAVCHRGYNLASNGRHCEGVIPRLNLKYL